MLKKTGTILVLPILLLGTLSPTAAVAQSGKLDPEMTEICAMTVEKALAAMKSKDLKERKKAFTFAEMAVMKSGPNNIPAMTDCIKATGKDVLPIFAAAVNDPDKSMRRKALPFLGAGDPAARVALLGARALEDPDEDVRQFALLTLSDMNDKSTGPWFEKSMEQDPAMWNREYAAGCYAMVLGKEAIPFLKKTLEGAKEPEYRMKLCNALGYAGDASGYLIAMKGLESAEWRVQEQAAYALGYIGNPGALPALRKLSAKSDPYGVAFKAKEAILRIEFRSKPYPENIAMAEKDMSDPSAGVRSWAAQELVNTGRPEVIQYLKDQAKKMNMEARQALNWKHIEWYESNDSKK